MRIKGFTKRFLLSLLFLQAFLLAGSPTGSKEVFDRKTPLVVAVEKVGPAVVNIYTEEAPQVRNPFRDFGESPFDRFFRDFLPPQNPGRQSLGSGVVINPQGHILTNEHVIARAARIKITLIDKREFEARLIGADIKSDLAIVKVDSDAPLPFVDMGESNDLMIGETVIAIGNPFGLQHTVTSGIVSALNRTIRAGKDIYQDFIQVDASINPGNSGGPLLNINGELIGINTAIFQKAEGIGFAIPIQKAKRIVNDLIRFGKVRQGWVGVLVQDLDANLSRSFRLDRPAGVLVTKVFGGSPAGKAGIRPGDVILSVDNHGVENKSDYLQRIGAFTVDNAVDVTLWRDGEKKNVRVTVADIPPDFASEFAQNWLGIRVKTITRELMGAYRLGSAKGAVIVQVNPQGACGRVGIRPGDVIRQVNQDPVNNEEDFNKFTLEAGRRNAVLLLVQRGHYGYYVTLEP